VVTDRLARTPKSPRREQGTRGAAPTQAGKSVPAPQRVDALRDRVEALQAQLAEVEAEGAASDVQIAELTAQLRQARPAVRTPL